VSDDVDGPEFIAEHLAAARVFRKYGFSDKAWDEYVAVLERFPDNPEATQELGSLDWKSDASRLATLKKITGRDWSDK
jgi:hypothetical protein